MKKLFAVVFTAFSLVFVGANSAQAQDHQGVFIFAEFGSEQVDSISTNTTHYGAYVTRDRVILSLDLMRGNHNHAMVGIGFAFGDYSLNTYVAHDFDSFGAGAFMPYGPGFLGARYIHTTSNMQINGFQLGFKLPVGR